MLPQEYKKYYAIKVCFYVCKMHNFYWNIWKLVKPEVIVQINLKLSSYKVKKSLWKPFTDIKISFLDNLISFVDFLC